MAAVTAGITYVFGRKYRQQQFYPVFISLLLTFMISGLPLFWGIGPFAVLWYIVIANLTDNLIWTANEPKIMDMMDNEVRASHSSYYRIIIDREWCVNIGRVGMYGIFLGLALVNQTLALQVVASLSGLTALLITLPTLKRHKS